MQKEILLQKEYLNESIATIYFGGGTPSILPAKEIQDIISLIKETFTFITDTEITLEANPDDITVEKLNEWKQTGINRLSIGVQSFFDEDLQWMNRAHTATHARECIKLAQEAGFDNITIDLIYGTPTLTDEHWLQNMHIAIALGIPHLSCYALTVEQKTALYKMIQQHKVENVDVEKQSRHFEMLMDTMHQQGYEQYEISNFAKPNYRSKHNSSYWSGAHYLGIGPSAHSFNGRSRQWNIANNALYIKSLQENVIPFEKEELTSIQQLNEYIMTSLRTIEGINFSHVIDTWGEEEKRNIQVKANKYVTSDLAYCDEMILKLTDKGRLLADGIASDLFVM